jgi:hypothetical protein
MNILYNLLVFLIFRHCLGHPSPLSFISFSSDSILDFLPWIHFRQLIFQDLVVSLTTQLKWSLLLQDSQSFFSKACLHHIQIHQDWASRGGYQPFHMRLCFLICPSISSWFYDQGMSGSWPLPWAPCTSS